MSLKTLETLDLTSTMPSFTNSIRFDSDQFAALLKVLQSGLSFIDCIKLLLPSILVFAGTVIYDRWKEKRQTQKDVNKENIAEYINIKSFKSLVEFNITNIAEFFYNSIGHCYIKSKDLIQSAENQKKLGFVELFYEKNPNDTFSKLINRFHPPYIADIDPMKYAPFLSKRDDKVFSLSAWSEHYAKLFLCILPQHNDLIEEILDLCKDHISIDHFLITLDKEYRLHRDLLNVCEILLNNLFELLMILESIIINSYDASYVQNITMSRPRQIYNEIRDLKAEIKL